MANEPNKLAKEAKVLEGNVTEPEKVEKKVEKKTPAPKKAAKKTRAPRARKPEDLLNEVVKKMTDKEKEVLIKFLKEDNAKMGHQIEALRENIEAAYKKVNLIEAQYNDMEKFYRDNLAYIDDQVVAFTNCVRRATVGGAK